MKTCTHNMKMVFWTIFFGTSFFIGIKGLNMCTSTGNLINNTYQGLRLVNHIIVRYLAVTFMTCGQNCLRRSACKSFNYNIQNGTCELNYVDVQMGISEAAAGYMVTDIQNWTQELVGLCSSHSCPQNSVCVLSSTDSFYCEVEGCVPPPEVVNGTLIPPDNLSIGTVLQYVCDPGYSAVGSRSCGLDGQWTSFECQTNYIRNCTMLKNCNPSYVDGEYWLYPQIFVDQPVKIYCSLMDTNSPTEYVTLPHQNKFDNAHKSYLCGFTTANSFGETVYSKVRVNIGTMVIDGKDLNFAAGSSKHTWFGYVGDCWAKGGVCHFFSKDKSGVLYLDSGETGLLFNTTKDWVTFPGESAGSSTIETFSRSQDNVTIHIACSGDCAGCHPDGDQLEFELNYNYVPPLSSAIDPVCQ